ncbi:DUF456 domain-containing protein [Frankia sp. CNm7]|uniref:DUF456 domain-containing protein n=1 Tax=Frankia nepalensis TaxID=1836974 RepID=A0A937RU95_9ACTN|nr:DUF456 domain-containing protein [Frankia nepalensis]MBL7501034.1 DUF456 domain-containing protein [Frankia nepalensis]MBL7514257.1 DUF456 domain-containing protein [Frankia nepalensis]MBL7518816.1 DUF456 domain-containing protein [Frankia nepalensis]MBL7632006.1 DUF456 domain-containing protein [Frankia nepalensis]
MHFVVGLVMAVGLVGVIVPVLPGLVIVLGAGLWWTIADGGGVRWAVFAVMVVLAVIGAVAQYVLPAKATKGKGAPWTTLLVGAVGAVIGFFVIPVVGLPVGGLLGIYAAEAIRLRNWRDALSTTWAAVIGIGIGILVELLAGILAALTWLISAIVL